MLQGVTFRVAKPHRARRNRFFFFFFKCCLLSAVLLLDHTARKALHMWQSRYNSSRAASCFLCENHGRRLLNVYVNVCVECVLSQEHSQKRAVEFVVSSHSLTAQQQKSTQQQFGSATATATLQPLAFVAVVTVYVSARLVHSRRSNHDGIFTSKANIKHTSLDSLPGTHNSSSSYQCILLEHWNASPFSTCDKPAISCQPHHEGGP